MLAQAGFFDFVGTFMPQSAQSAQIGPVYNSQTMPLLSPAKNITPNPSVGGGDILIADGALIAQESPLGTRGDVSARPQASQISIHVVREGDTLSQIAELYSVSINTIVWANDIKGRYIQPGQELVILPITGVRHTVAKGETFASIAKKYDGDAQEIANYNERALSAVLAAGDIVIIPDGVIAASPAAKYNPGSSATPTLGSSGGPSISGYYGWPVDGGVLTQGLHGFNGIDIGAGYGTNIYAAAAGTVIVAREGGYNGGYGSYVVIQHSNGTQTLYAHLSSVTIAQGTTVSKGQVIGKMGSTGKSTGNHLHFEVRGASNPFR
ncbi:peptidoglycan DD-metalloendopeptidase family protein [Candidatus Nomurabacteria bacterium]|nr:peptidoglycan DD-metalloendopeptidase family protein [Candidatus Nomurabacteria bacterium]